MDFIIFAINFIFSLYYLILVVRALLPWFLRDRRNPLFHLICLITDPLLNPIRQGLPPQKFGMDVSPFILIFLLWLIQKILLFFWRV
jgi:uncharacterized protein YggT (Ycf19 family)